MIQDEYHTNEQTIQYSQFRTKLIFNLEKHSQYKTNKETRFIKHYISFNDVYDLTENKPYCLVFNVLNCSKWSKELQRNGAEVINELVKDTFVNLNCEVYISNNSTKQEIFDILKEKTQGKIVKNHSAFILYITSHGNENGFESADGILIKIKEVLEYFSDQNCEDLRRKPKIILLDFCQTELKHLTKSEFDQMITKLESKGKYSDIFVLRSTLKGLSEMKMKIN